MPQTREYLVYQELQAANEYLVEYVISIKTKYSFYFNNGRFKTAKMGAKSYAEPSPLQCSLHKPLAKRDQCFSTFFKGNGTRLINDNSLHIWSIQKNQIISILNLTIFVKTVRMNYFSAHKYVSTPQLKNNEQDYRVIFIIISETEVHLLSNGSPFKHGFSF